MACKIAINAKRRKQSWESKYEMLSVTGSMKRSSGGPEKSLLQKEVLSKEWMEARSDQLGDKSILGRGVSAGKWKWAWTVWQMGGKARATAVE